MIIFFYSDRNLKGHNSSQSLKSIILIYIVCKKDNTFFTNDDSVPADKFYIEASTYLNI